MNYPVWISISGFLWIFLSLREFNHLDVLNLSSNKFETFPLCITESESISQLNFEKNLLNELPEALFHMSNLIEINVQQNYLDLISIPRDINPHIDIKRAQFQYVPSLIVDRLYCGSQESAYNKEFLKENNITHILAIGDKLTLFHPDDFVYKHVIIEDFADCDIKQYWDEFIDYIQDGLDAGGSVLVHCAAGISRSGSTIVAYLMKKHEMNFDEALSKAKSRRFVINPNEGFIRQLREYEQSLATEN
eukprot:TRINITY_DN147_c0_g1_i1.p1 TRINITY_DN147_c0_g1~~TRINITY_DN147_c0_g1_i1.p1  ORF type:complete len:248 (-),score=50.75 TRINITY_DN147_c0_g1_i1:156-899(-)